METLKPSVSLLPGRNNQFTRLFLAEAFSKFSLASQEFRCKFAKNAANSPIRVSGTEGVGCQNVKRNLGK